ncbi:hypothetical protein RUM44_007100 [Polyplax serrata]|uniref:Uncharacterized protein n=1 Tax=Polyplax serrata TaxID=468196 RepID=A0ABR1AZT0_POLSC
MQMSKPEMSNYLNVKTLTNRLTCLGAMGKRLRVARVVRRVFKITAKTYKSGQLGFFLWIFIHKILYMLRLVSAGLIKGTVATVLILGTSPEDCVQVALRVDSKCEKENGESEIVSALLPC